MTIEELRSGYARYKEEYKYSITFEDFVSRCESDEAFRNKYIRQKSVYDPVKFGYTEDVQSSNADIKHYTRTLGSIEHRVTIFGGDKVQFCAHLESDKDNYLYNTQAQLMTPNEFKTLVEMFSRNYNG